MALKWQVVQLIIVITTYIVVASGYETNDFKVTSIPSSSGLYYDHVGQIEIYSTTWRIVTYVNLDVITERFQKAERYGKAAVQRCRDTLKQLNVGLIECRVLDQQVTHHVEKITGLQQLVQQLTKHETRRKRGVFNFVGQVSKTLFGKLDEADAAYYKERIDAMEKNSEGLLRLTKEQVAVVRATLAGVNRTVYTLESNEHILRTGMQRLERFMKEYVKETDMGFKRVATFATVTEQVLQLAAVFGQIEEEYEQMINAIVNAQKGILQPHISNPVQIVKYLSLIRDELKDVKFPVPLAESSGYLLLRIIDLDVFISGSILGYVINIPLIDNNNFNLYRVLPLPKEIPNMKGRYIYIQPEKEFLLIDESKRQYAKLSADDLKCKELSKNRRLCRQSFALLSTFAHEECEAKLLQPVREIPEDCVRKIVALNQSLWTHLNSNEWLYVAPKEEGLTVLCGKEPPKDLLMKGVGKISFYSKCKGYGTRVFIQTDRVIHSNVTKKDIIPQINLEFDCCVVNEEKKNVSMLTLDLPLEQVVTQLDDLKIAGKILDDVQRMAERQEEELKYSRYFTHYSVTTYIAIAIVIVIVIRCCCKNCKCCKECFKSLWKYFDDSNCCGKVCIRNTIVNQYPETSLSRRQANKVTEEVVIYERCGKNQ
ncbi:uncharacterized protein LOC126249565 [Schistocerca nitens]|uniref:uncharacterized protein LOC126249565 n=1 Tax=Schistocerca nitens TaxID=7011 RepID=UPI002118DCFB|nr:uncharacterized protein LOC126249565 [Schistocerca nitens]